MRDEKDRFYDRVKGRVNLNNDPRAGLRESILSNQTLKALVYIEMLFDQLDGDGKKAEEVLGTKAEGTTVTPDPAEPAPAPNPVESTPKPTKTAKKASTATKKAPVPTTKDTDDTDDKE